MNNEKIIEVKMDYNEFKNLFNKAIFERSKPDLLKKIAANPERYVGIFRPTKPEGKVVQNLLHSHEIKFGDVSEVLIEKYLEENDFSICESRLFADDGARLEVDHVCRKGDRVVFIEQKIRDDHDSSKIVGQIDNFERKIEAVCTQYPESEVIGFFYFIDGSFKKNQNYYGEKILGLSTDYGKSLHLSYGRELFEQLGMAESWDELVDHLIQWREQIPNIPNINFDSDPEESFNEIKDVSAGTYRKIFTNPDLLEVLEVLFPERTTLNLLTEFFAQQYQQGGKTIDETLHNLCVETIRELESRNPPS